MMNYGFDLFCSNQIVMNYTFYFGLIMNKFGFALKGMAVSVGVALALQSGVAQADGSLSGMGFYPGDNVSGAYAVSADGSTVLGYSFNFGGGGDYHGVVWRNGVVQLLPGLPYTLGAAGGTAISGDGSIVAGWAYNSIGSIRAVRWVNGVIEDIGDLGGRTDPNTIYSFASGVSADGLVVVGFSSTASYEHAFRWENGVMQDLGTVPGGMGSRALGISANGKVVVGYSDIDFVTGPHAFRWENGVMQDLGMLPGGLASIATATSKDGSVTVGLSSTVDQTQHAVKWENGVILDLGTLAGLPTSAANSVSASADGTVIIGSVGNSTGSVPFRWTSATGMQTVVDWLAAANVSLPAGWSLSSADSTNKDGSVVVGTGQDSNGQYTSWLARVTTTRSGGGRQTGGSGIISVNAYNQSVAQTSTTSVQTGAGLPTLALYGAHHRSLMDSGLVRTADGMCAWATADAAHYDSTKTDMQLAEAGVCKDIGDARLGIGLGETWAKQDWSLGGSAKYDGPYLLAEADYKFDDKLIASVSGYYSKLSSTLDRHYQNGATVDSSSGSPDAHTTALRLRLDWLNAGQVGEFVLSPYAVYTQTRTKLDAYTETGGGFPASYEATTSKSNDLRAGLAAKKALSGSTDLRLSGEVAHRLDTSVDGINGQVIGLWSFSQPGTTTKQNWLRLIGDIDYRLSKTSLLTFGFSAATTGGDPTWGLTMGWRGAF